VSDVVSPKAALSRRGFLAGTAGGVVAVALNGCGRSSVTGNAVRSSAPKHGGMAVITAGNDIAPPLIFSVNGNNLNFNRLVYNTLTDLDHRTLKPLPSLATKWTLSPDRRTYTLQLRDDVVYHSGRPFGPQDVIAAVGILKDPAHSTQFRRTAAVISDVSASGPHEVKLQLSHPINNLFDLFENMYITDHETVSEALAGKAFIGTGPFKFKSFTPQVATEVVKNPHYWKTGRPYLDGVKLMTIANANAVVSSLKSRQTNITMAVATSALPEFDHNPSFRVTQVDTNADSSFIGINTAVPPLNKKEVRQAIAYALDRTQMFKQAFRGTGQNTDLSWPQNSPAYQPDLVTHYEQNLQKARSLLQQAGVGGFQTEIAESFQNDPVALIAQANLRQIGIDAKIRTYVGGAQFFQKLVAGTFAGMFSNGHLFGNLQPSTLLNSALPYNAAHNSSNFNDPTYKELAQQIWSLPPGPQLQSAYRAITTLLLDEAFVLEINTGGDNYVTSNNFQGWKVNMFDYMNLDDAYLGDPG